MSERLKNKIKKGIFKYKNKILFIFISLGTLTTIQLIKYYLIINQTIVEGWTWDDSLWINMKIHLNDKLWWDKIKMIDNPIFMIFFQGFALFFLIIHFFLMLKKKKWKIWLWIVYLGSLGNFINRLWCFPYVIDYFLISNDKMKIYFNLEDLMIWIGFIGLFVWACQHYIKKLIYKHKEKIKK